MESNSITDLIKSLLYESEGTSLDFKQTQYPYKREDNNDKKSEFLKDILAFANSWRKGDAYILIGVKENQTNKHTIVGCEDHPDEATFQQFINSKTNRNVMFSYTVHLIEGEKIGLFTISKQQRPIYAKRDYGKVKKEVVYYRLRSSTKVATPDNIYEMGKDDYSIEVSTPVLDLQFTDQQQKKLGTEIELKSIFFEESSRKLGDASIIKYFGQGSEANILNSISSPTKPVNRDYWRDLEEYTRIKYLVKPFRWVIYNPSSVAAKNIYIEIINDFDKCILAKKRQELPMKPHISNLYNINIKNQEKDERIIVDHFNKNYWILKIKIGDINPKSTIITDCFYIGSLETTTFNIEAKIYGENLPEPQICPLIINFEVEKRNSLTIDKLSEIHDDILGEGIVPLSSLNLEFANWKN